MKLENSLLNISMPQSDRVQEPSKAQSQASGRTLSAQTAGDGVDLGSQAGLVKPRRLLVYPIGRASRRVCGRWFNPVSIKWIAPRSPTPSSTAAQYGD